MPIRALLSTVILACAALSGCGSDGDSHASANAATESPSQLRAACSKAPRDTDASPTSVTPANYAFKYHGNKGTVLFPAPATDPRLAEVERYRKAAKAKPVHYVIVEVDSPCGSIGMRVFGVNVTTADNHPVHEAEIVSDSIAYWEANKGGPSPPRNPADEMSKTARRYYEQTKVAPGEKDTIIFVDWFRRRGTPAHVYVATGADFMTAVEATKVP